MSPESKVKYCKLINEKLDAAQKHLAELEHAHNTSESRMTSRYDSQRESFAMEIVHQTELLKKIIAFRDFIEQGTSKGQVEEGAEFTVEIQETGKTITDALYSPIMLKLDGVQIITPSSPIGAAIQGLEAGSNFVYRVGRELMHGQVKNVR